MLLPTGEVERRLIRTGDFGMPGRQEVLSGVAAGDRVLLSGGTNKASDKATGKATEASDQSDGDSR